MHRSFWQAAWGPFWLTVVLSVGIQAAEIDFVRDVQPIFQKHCVSCHGAESQKSGLRLDIKSEAFKGVDGWGPSLVAGRASESPIIELVTSEDVDSRMPPEGDPLSAAEIAVLTEWIDSGALWPDGVDLAELEDRLDHWSFKPMTSPTAPEVQRGDWPRGSIDRFVLSRLEQDGLSPAPEADVVSWLRRVSVDLTGLPPTPREVNEFIEQARRGEAAYAIAVNRLLQSPRYGERWAQHWLDVVRYADTHGFEVNTERPNAWPYRDYVIAAMNADTPYDRFIKEQIAGDALGADAATGFLVTASVLLPGQIGKDAPSMRLARQDALDEIVNNVSQTFLGMSVGCARCHDHKFDPITAKDYYSMQAFVAGVEYGDRKLRTPHSEALERQADAFRERVAEIDDRLALLVPPARPRVDQELETYTSNARENTETFEPLDARFVRFTIHDANLHPSLGLIEPCLDEVQIFTDEAEPRNVALASHGTKVTASGSRMSSNHKLEHINDGQFGNSRSWMSDSKGTGWVMFELPDSARIAKVVWSRDRNGKFTDRLATAYTLEAGSSIDQLRTVKHVPPQRASVNAAINIDRFSTVGLNDDETRLANRLLGEKRSLEQRIKAAERGQVAFAGTFRQPDEIHRLHRGDPEQPREAVAPAVLSAIGELALPIEAAEQQRRRALADWIADPQNPLTARVMVNRIWQGHFGIGLVDTPNDFGRNGTAPTHPRLLDWLAQEFIRSGWSIKHMHRLIVLSSTYRQSNQFDPQAAAVDADVRLLWRYPSRRLEAEAIRDAMLAASGQLNLKMGGRGFNLFNKRGGLSGFTPVDSFGDDGLRRMIYAHKVRRERDAVFGAFDCPDAGQSTARRIESTTPIQALNLLNSRFTIETAAALAERVAAEAGDEIGDQIRRAYQVVFNRDPEHDELHQAIPVIREFGLETLCRAMFNSNEFLFYP
ncbi:Planctomycete cytochrome C [Stieleria maiorica]|uniref:Planctomycete cytochrome C n=1 Tax=Stieleria maiorica TaxID=2795974 RepID=A0A5B9MGK4_9BACT|nr:PSD1 and planctomycete cytochrome C domain-containing protein [Stieleria maiorica]QEF99236.1 Planctomycete cytochrome C [Stieleria maiorica]